MIFMAVIVGWLCFMVTVLSLARAAGARHEPPVVIVIPPGVGALLADMPDIDLDGAEALLRTLAEIEDLPEADV